MADSSIGGGSAAPESSASNRHAIIPAPIAADNQHVCFICLQNDTDTPNATWVNPCPCSLEAHEECMLDWVADMETSQGRSKNGLRCPACKAPIKIQEPYDLFIALRDGLTRRYSRLSPYILLVLVSSGGVAGASWYGWGAAAIFAGPDAVVRWFRPRPGQGFPSIVMKIWALSAIGPSLVVMRWLPSLASAVWLPFSLAVSDGAVLSLAWSAHPLTDAGAFFGSPPQIS
jgi:hypothetical protein